MHNLIANARSMSNEQQVPIAREIQSSQIQVQDGLERSSIRPSPGYSAHQHRDLQIQRPNDQDQQNSQNVDDAMMRQSLT